jgi:hypothetical protein
MNNQALTNKDLQEYQQKIILQSLNCDTETLAKIQIEHQQQLLASPCRNKPEV